MVVKSLKLSKIASKAHKKRRSDNSNNNFKKLHTVLNQVMTRNKIKKDKYKKWDGKFIGTPNKDFFILRLCTIKYRMRK